MDFQSIVERKLEPVGTSNRDIIYRCPQCEGDSSSGHLYVNYDKGYYHCFKCNLSGKRIEGLLKVLHIDIDFDYSKIYDDQVSELDSIISLKDSKEIEDTEILEYSTDLQVLTSYYYLHSTSLSDKAFQYLIHRGLSPQLISKLEMREGLNRFGEKFNIKGYDLLGRDYSGRIMIPSLRRDGLISFYLGRDYLGRDNLAKYINPPKELVASSEDVWNLDMVESESVIICEGVMTAIAASPYKLNSVATYGKSIATVSSNDRLKVTSQGEKLLARKFKNYIICYDADAHKEALQSAKYLYDRGANVYVVLIDPKKYGPKADVADIGYEEFLKLLRVAEKYDGGLSWLSI